MKYLDTGLRFEFTEDYITGVIKYVAGTKCNTLNGVVVLDNEGNYLFDTNSKLANKYGKLIIGF